MSCNNYKVGDKVRSLGESIFGEDCATLGLVGTIVRVVPHFFGGNYLIDFGPDFHDGHDGSMWGEEAFEEESSRYYYLEDSELEAA